MEPVTSSVSGIDTVLSDPLLSTKTVRERPVISTHIRGRCHAISQSSKIPHISGPSRDPRSHRRRFGCPRLWVPGVAP